jgi:hypothetical protein
VTKGRNRTVLLDEHDLRLKDVGIVGKRKAEHFHEELLTMAELFVGDLRALRPHSLEDRAQVLRKYLLVAVGGLGQEALVLDVGAKLEKAQGPDPELVEALDIGLRRANRLGFAGAAHQAGDEKKASQAAAHGLHTSRRRPRAQLKLTRWRSSSFTGSRRLSDRRSSTGISISRFMKGR